MPNTRDPQVKDAWFSQTHENAETVGEERNAEHPEALEDQEQLDRQDRVDNEEAIGHARKHLRASKGGEDRSRKQIKIQKILKISLNYCKYY